MLFGKKFLNIFFSFGFMQAAQIFLPLLALPWLARVLGAEAFGLLMYMALLPPIIGLVLDWGLLAGGARATASGASPGPVLGNVLAAKINLAVFCLAACLLAWPIIPHAAAHPAGWWAAFLAGIARGSSPVWFFQGTGRGMRKMAAFDVCSALLVLLLTFMFVRAPGQWPLYLLFYAICKGCAYGWLTFALARKYGARPAFGLATLWRTKTLFAGPLAQTVCNSATQMLMGYWLSAAQSGLLNAAHKMLRALAGAVNPLAQTLYPEACKLGKNKIGRLLLFSTCGVLLFMLAVSALCWALAPWLIRLAMGEGYGGAAEVLRIMLFGAPLMAANQMIITQGLLPCGLEKIQARAQGFAALASLPLAALLAAKCGLTGCAWLPPILEATICALLCLGLWRSRQIIFAARQRS